MTKLRGVNLGGWLVLERWMTGGLFAGTDAVDEYTFMQTPGALDKLCEHQENFIREEDFPWMRANGVIAGQTIRRYPKDQHESLQHKHIRHQLDAYQLADSIEA